MKTTNKGAKAPPQFEQEIIQAFREQVSQRRERLGRKMAALLMVKDDIKTARDNDWNYSEIAHHLSKGNLLVDSTTVARFCRDFLGEKKRKGKKDGGSSAASSPAPMVTTSAATTTPATSKPEVEVP
jgi:hypothetical protein